MPTKNICQRASRNSVGQNVHGRWSVEALLRSVKGVLKRPSLKAHNKNVQKLAEAYCLTLNCLVYTAYTVLQEAVVPLTVLKVSASVVQALLLSLCTGSFLMPVLTRFCLNEQSKLCQALRRAVNDDAQVWSGLCIVFMF